MNDEAWDALCINPHKSALQEGRDQGEKDGLLSGYQEGYVLGKTTAIEYGMEVGFVRGAVGALLDKKLPNKTQKTLKELTVLLDEFPDSDSMFQNPQSVRTHDLDDTEQEDRTSALHNLQRIRARFKLLTAQLGMSNLSLKHLMDEAAAGGHSQEQVSEW